ncbi:MAG: hypothetical protein R2851_24060 [Caldilineaceae bacterium]
MTASLPRCGLRARLHVDARIAGAADIYAGEQMVGLIEEVHKGLEGLQRE